MLKALRIPELPLLRRELVALLRTRKAAWCVRLVVIFSGAIPLCFWPSEHARAMLGVESVATFCAFFLAQLTTALILVPAFTAGAIAGEREGDTYDALYTTLLRPSSIVLSKMAASAGFILLVLVIASPAAFVLYFLGGLTLATILECYAVLAAALISSAIICLYYSMGSKRTSHAAVRGYFWVFFWNVGLMALSALLMGLTWSIWGTNPTSSPLFSINAMVMTLTSPYIVIPSALGPPGGPGFWGPPLGLEPWMCYVAFAGLVALVHFLLLVRKARTPEPPPVRWLERRALRRKSGAKPIRRSILTRWLTPTPEREAHLFANPIFHKELLSEFFGRLRYRRATFWLPLVLFGAIAAAFADEGLGVQCSAAIHCVALTLIVLPVPAVAASSFPREAEQGNLDFLRGTHLTWIEIQRGKFWAAVFSGAGIIAAAAWVTGGIAIIHALRNGWSTSFSIFTFWHPKYKGGEWLVYMALQAAVLSLTLLSTAALATTISSFSRRTLGALVATYGLLIAWLVGIPFLLLIADGPGNDVEDILGAIDPYVAIVMTGDKRAGSTIAYLLIAAVFTFFLTFLAAARLDDSYAVDR